MSAAVSFHVGMTSLASGQTFATHLAKAESRAIPRAWDWVVCCESVRDAPCGVSQVIEAGAGDLSRKQQQGRGGESKRHLAPLLDEERCGSYDLFERSLGLLL